MMRIVTVACILTAALAVGAAPAYAHLCPVASVIPVHKSAPVKVAVTVEAVPIGDVEIQLPPELQLDHAEPTPRWTTSGDGASLRYHGPPMTPYSCQYFTLFVTATAKGRFGIAVVQRDAKGTVVASTVDPRHKTNAAFQQLVYAGVKPPQPSGSDSSGTSPVLLAGIVLIGGGVLVAVVVAVRNRRARRAEERDEELSDRIDAFKKQTQDRSTQQ